jgi:hypothetical protein
MSQTDNLYQEGIILGDFVINEFSNSPVVMRILDQDEDLREKLIRNLRTEVADYRKKCIEVLRMCEFVDESERAVPVPPSPSEVSRSALQALMAKPLEVHSLGRKPLASSTSNASPSPSRAAQASGVFSGLPMTDESSEEETVEVRINPDRILESAFPVAIFGALDSDKTDFRASSNRKRKRPLTEGFFTKDGNYNAVVYGGFVQLCGGALEWPFRNAEVSFMDFFKNQKKIEN